MVSIEEDQDMKNRMIGFGMLVAVLGVLSAGDASAGILSATASGPGGTVTNIVIDTANVTNDAISFDATYTALAPITFDLTVSGPGEYFIGFLTGSLTNSTGSSFSSFYTYLENAPSGSEMNEAGYNSFVFSSVTFIPEVNPTSITFNGPPGLATGGTTDIYTAIDIPGSVSGTQTFQVVWTPTPLSVPEPSTLVLGLTAAIVGLGCLAPRRARRQA
jgi:hypothetical protein